MKPNGRLKLNRSLSVSCSSMFVISRYTELSVRQSEVNEERAGKSNVTVVAHIAEPIKPTKSFENLFVAQCASRVATHS